MASTCWDRCEVRFLMKWASSTTIDRKPKLESQGRRVVEVDVSKRKDLAKKYGVTLVPLAVSVAADGRVLGRL